MPDNEIPQNVLDQAREAAAPARASMDAPATGEPINQPVPDAPADMSGVPDPYDVAGQETYRADQRASAVAERDAMPEAQTAAPEAVSAEQDVNNVGPEDYDTMLEQAMKQRESARTDAALSPAAGSTPEAATPEQDVSLNPTTPEPQGPSVDKD